MSKGISRWPCLIRIRHSGFFIYYDGAVMSIPVAHLICLFYHLVYNHWILIVPPYKSKRECFCAIIVKKLGDYFQIASFCYKIWSLKWFRRLLDHCLQHNSNDYHLFKYLAVLCTASRTSSMLPHFIFYNSAMKIRYYPHFTDGETEAQLNTMPEVTQQVRGRPKI